MGTQEIINKEKRRKIEMRYSRVKEQTEELKKIAQEMRKMADGNLQNLKEEIYAAWKSDSTDKYVMAIELKAVCLRKTAGKLEKMAENILWEAQAARGIDLSRIEQ